MSRPARPNVEPAFNAPGAALVLAGSILGLYVVQSRMMDDQRVVAALGLIPRQVQDGQFWRLLSVLLVHGSWSHAFLNALGALAFGAPLARWFGRSRRGGAVFLLFYLACGLIASAGYLLLHQGSAEVLVGASGAISGLMGASSRLIDGRGRLAPFTSRSVLGMVVGWGFINVLMALRWVDVGSGGAPIAWEAHVFGYAAGLGLVGPASRLCGDPI